jgi:hypothetical protein
MLRIISWLLGLALIALVLILFFGGQLFQKAGNALINAINGSAVHGLAQVVPSNTGNSSDVQVNLQGLASQSRYDVTLDENTCGGTVVQNLGTVTTDANGNVTATFIVPDISQYAQQTLWVDVHQSTSSSSQSTACGQVQLNSTATSQVNVLNTTGSTNSSTSSSTISSNTAPSGVSNSNGSTSTTDTSGLPNSTGLPNSGVAPGGSNSYDNYTFPRKY